MPTYEYACDACGFEFEKEQRISEDPIKKCPKCGKAKARRMITQGNFILKGGGWYSDGYATASNKKAETSTASSPAPASSDASASEASTTSSSGDDKPAKKEKTGKKKAGKAAA